MLFFDSVAFINQQNVSVFCLKLLMNSCFSVVCLHYSCDALLHYMQLSVIRCSLKKKTVSLGEKMFLKRYFKAM